MSDRTAEHVAQLAPDVARVAVDLINAARAAGVPLVITSSRRTVDEQRRLVAAGRSQTLNSKHIAGRAFDVDVMGVNRDAVPRWWWSALGNYGERLGLRWGGRWKTIFDPGHFEL